MRSAPELQPADAGVKSAEANDVSTQADIKSRAADLEHAKLDWERGQLLFKEGLIPKQDYDTRKATYDGAVAALASAQARAEQARAQLGQARSGLTQNQAMLGRLSDILNKTTYTAPINGVVTYIAVRVGENVVPGIQNATGSYLMTISDMSVVTSEVMVDETDIVSVKLGEDAEVTIDAIPGKFFKGKVTEVGTQAVLRSSGLASTQSTTGNQEAKDFKVVVTLQNPPDGLRPGLSSTAKITTAQKKNVMTVPIQALAERTKKDLDEAAKENGQKFGHAGGRPPRAWRRFRRGFLLRPRKKSGNSGRLCGSQQTRSIRARRDRNHRRHRHRGFERPAGRRSDHHRKLQDPAHAQA